MLTALHAFRNSATVTTQSHSHHNPQCNCLYDNSKYISRLLKLGKMKSCNIFVEVRFDHKKSEAVWLYFVWWNRYLQFLVGCGNFKRTALYLMVIREQSYVMMIHIINFLNRKWQDYVYIQCEYKSTKQKIKHLLREENKVKENKIS